jgi:hypothetical protein
MYSAKTIRSTIRHALRTPRQRAEDAALEARLDDALWRQRERAAALAMPEPIRAGAWTGYPCPWCDAAPASGWQWYSDAGTWFERLHLLLSCTSGHAWSINTDMG